MPLNPRVRDNNVFGTIEDNPLTSGATTLNSGGLSTLSTIAVQHAVLTLDPLRQFGYPEIVVVTTHTASATVATITRGAYGTVAREHPKGTLWVHAPVRGDFTQIVTSSTRPTDPYRGQMIFEYDTDKFVARSVTDVWQDVLPLGAFATWSPIVTQSNTPAQTVNRARYIKTGRLVHLFFNITLTAAGTTTQPIRVTNLPFAVASIAGVSGSAHYYDAGNTNFLLMPAGDLSTAVGFERDGYGNRFGNGDIIIAANDVIEGVIIYEAVS